MRGQCFTLESQGASIQFFGRLERGVVVWPDRDIPYLDQVTLKEAGLLGMYEKALRAADGGDNLAIWGNPLLMNYAFRPLEEPLPVFG